MCEFIKEKFFLDKLSIKINESFDYLFKIFIISEYKVFVLIILFLKKYSYFVLIYSINFIVFIKSSLMIFKSTSF